MHIHRPLLILAVCGALAGCAASGPDPLPPEPAARVSLQPEYRLFYDALVDYGDWILIEPYGYVFRPRVDYLTWRPYTNGYWVASDSYGWIWVSAESFGWATEHYGRWMWDDYQGYVWVPGIDWGPAWVTWEMGGPWVGWAAMSPSGMPVSGSRLPSGSFVFAPVQNLGSANVSTSLVTRDALGSAASTMRPVANPGERDGVRFNRGPSISEVERMQGRTLDRARIEDVLPAHRVGKPATGAPLSTPADSLFLPSPATVKSAGDDAARFSREVKGNDAPAPGRVPLIRPFLHKHAPAAPSRAPVSRSSADSSRAGHK